MTWIQWLTDWCYRHIVHWRGKIKINSRYRRILSGQWCVKISTGDINFCSILWLVHSLLMQWLCGVNLTDGWEKIAHWTHFIFKFLIFIGNSDAKLPIALFVLFYSQFHGLYNVHTVACYRHDMKSIVLFFNRKNSLREINVFFRKIKWNPKFLSIKCKLNARKQFQIRL